MSIYRRSGQKEWSYDFQISGRRFSGTTGSADKREANKVLAQKREEAKSLIASEKKFSLKRPITFEEAASTYWHQKGQFLANSSDRYLALQWLVENFGRTTHLNSITDNDIATMIAKRRLQGVSNATVNRTATEPLRALVNYAKQIWKVPVPDVKWKIHMLKEAQERVREASVEEEARLMEAIRDDYSPVLSFAIKAGCRRAEIIGLKWDKVDFFNREFTVTGKGDKSRTIPMSDAVYDLLWSLKDHHPVYVFTYLVKRPKRGYKKGDRCPISKSGLASEWRRTRKRSGVRDFRFHDARHTSATRLVRAKGNLRLAQILLGHADLASTARYAHATKEDLREGLNATHGAQRAKRMSGGRRSHGRSHSE